MPPFLFAYAARGAQQRAASGRLLGSLQAHREQAHSRRGARLPPIWKRCAYHPRASGRIRGTMYPKLRGRPNGINSRAFGEPLKRRLSTRAGDRVRTKIWLTAFILSKNAPRETAAIAWGLAGVDQWTTRLSKEDHPCWLCLQ